MKLFKKLQAHIFPIKFGRQKNMPPHPNEEEEAAKGQSLVEMAIILPILLLLMLGVFEVGWALRSYLVLTNVNREATRFSARGIYLDFTEKDDPTQVGYDKVVSHTLDSLSRQLAMDFVGGDPNASMIITYYNVEPTNFQCPGGDTKCLDDDGYPQHPGFDCQRFAYESRNNPDTNYFVPGDNLAEIQYPVLYPPFGSGPDPNEPVYYEKILTLTNTIPVTAYHYHSGALAYSKINPEEKIKELRGQTNVLNCQLVQKGLQPSDNSIVIVENIYFQDQLVGLPFIENYIPDPVPFYSHTAMRVATSRKQYEDAATSSCSPYPVIVPLSKVTGRSPGDWITIEVGNNSDVVPGNFSFLDWSGTSGSIGELEGNFNNPELAVFEEPDTNPVDDLLNVGDWIGTISGANTGAKGVIESWADPTPGAGTLMLLPVWPDLDCSSGCSSAVSSGTNGKFRVATFILVKLKEVHLTGNPAPCPNSACLIFEYISPAPDYCMCDPDTDGANCDLP